ncbi:MAG: flagellar biosynthesis protein FlgB [Marinosulfonomonas sp.]|nr:MAG: flagellar biosynthesis protein FlgB [Marinosulfonomonas sp.]
MFEKLEIFQMAGSMARHAASRQALTAQNIANADTPGYKARDLASFADTYQTQTGGMEMHASRAGHLMGSGASIPTSHIISGKGSESPNGNNVSLEGEMMKATEISGHHKRALAIYQSSLGILRASLGRR